jgi:choline dehydrogenase-like flavoprotein
MAFHPLGTARAHARADGGVVDADLRVHGVDRVLVADGSAVPTSLGANPQITIMALATRAAFRLLGRDAPDGEPFPETLPDLDLERAPSPS